MKPATTAQITKIHVLINQMGLKEDKGELIRQFSAIGATSTKNLTILEASNLLKHLSYFDPCDRMRRKVFALAYEAGIIYGDTFEDKKMNSIKLDKFLSEKGSVKKPIGSMTKEELQKTVNQFAQIIKHQEYTKAGKVAKQMLQELNIPAK